MKTSKAGRQFIESFEGLRLEAYQDSGGVWTIGYGHTHGVRKGQKITRAQADRYLAQDLAEAEKTINSVVKVELHQASFDALVSLVYNIGSSAFRGSTLLKKLNKGDFVGAQAEFLKWNHDNGRVVKGLTRRRQAESKMFWEGTPATKVGPLVKNPTVIGGTATAIAAGADVASKAQDQISTGTLIGVVAGLLILALGAYIVWQQYREHQTPDA